VKKLAPYTELVPAAAPSGCRRHCHAARLQRRLRILDHDCCYIIGQRHRQQRELDITEGRTGVQLPLTFVN
jgi:hypothetical protein